MIPLIVINRFPCESSSFASRQKRNLVDAYRAPHARACYSFQTKRSKPSEGAKELKKRVFLCVGVCLGDRLCVRVCSSCSRRVFTPLPCNQLSYYFEVVVLRAIIYSTKLQSFIYEVAFMVDMSLRYRFNYANYYCDAFKTTYSLNWIKLFLTRHFHLRMS